MNHSIRLTTGVLASLLLAPAGAQAATISLGGQGGPGDGNFNSVAYRGGEGERNAAVFTLSGDGRSLTVNDSGATITATPGNESACRISEGGRQATCTDPDGILQFEAKLRDADDRATSQLPGFVGPRRFSSSIGGGAGADTLTGSDTASDDLDGGSGNDTLFGRGGDDSLSDYDFDQFTGFSFGGTNVMEGGAGADYFLDGPDDDTLRGDAGNDQMVANAGGRDRVAGGDGQDFLDRSASVDGSRSTGTTSFDGGAGEDGARYSLFSNSETGEQVTPDSPGAIVRLDAGRPTTGNGFPGQEDTLASVENAFGSFGRDTLTGSAGPNRLSGSPGNDTIAGGAGLDVIDGGADRDEIDARDGGPDRVRCGDGPGGDPGDTASVDEADDLERCPAAGAGTTVTPAPRPAPEVVRVFVPGPATPAAPADTTRPDLSATSLPRSIRLRTLRSRGYRFTLRTTESAPASLEAQLLGRPRGRVRLSRAGDVVLAQRTTRFTRTTSVALKPSRALRNGLRRGSRLRVTIRVADAAGNVATRTVSIRVR